MKKLIFRKFLKDLTSFILLISLSITLIVWVVQAVNFLDFVSEDGHSFQVYFFYTLLNLPKIFSRILPFLFFISIFYIILKYENNNELIIFWTTGIKKIDFTKIIIQYSVIYIILQIIFNTYIVPKTQDLARSYIRSSNVDFFPSLIKSGKFIDTVSNLTIFIENEDVNGDFRNIFLKEDFNKNTSQIIFAKKGRIVNQNNNSYLILNDGKSLNKKKGETTVFGFQKSEFNLSNFTTKSTITPKIQELNTILLIKCFLLVKKNEKLSNRKFSVEGTIRSEDPLRGLDISSSKSFYERFSIDESLNYGSLNCNKNFLSNLKQELFKRFYLPFYFPLIALISCLLVTNSKDNYNFSKFKFFLFNFGVFILILSEVSIRYSGLTQLYSLIFILVPILLFILTYFYLFNKVKT